jgi:molybdenum cofactor biosynthesis enzyme MoaA
MTSLLSPRIRSARVERSYTPDACPYETVMLEVTHRCNMACRNCYIPNRTIADLGAAWLSSVLARLPRRTFVRLSGGEPTLRADLPALVRDVRSHGHHPVLMTNGLKLADRRYVRTLKAAGLQIVYLSMNGGFDDDGYAALDRMRCASEKRRAFENLRAEHVFTSIGMILARGVNEQALPRLLTESRRAGNVREFHLRSIGAMGRHMQTRPFTLDELFAAFTAASGADADRITRHARTAAAHDFRFGRMRVQLTVWPDLGSTTRGRLTPEGLVGPFMEHVIANEGGY